MPVRRSGPSLEVLNRALYKISSGEMRVALSKNLAAEARTQVMNSFRKSMDPYGHPWKPVQRGGQPLLLTGRLRNSIRAFPTAKGFMLETSVVYASIHDRGGSIRRKNGKVTTIPRRQFIPEPNDLGPLWTQAFVKVTKAVFREFVESEAHIHGHR